MIAIHRISVTTTGAAGSAAGTTASTRPVNGRLLAVYVDFTSQPATTDVTITSTGPTQSLLTLTNVNTDGWYYPRVLLQGITGANLTTVYDALPIAAYVSVAVAQGDAITDGVVVTLLVEC
jgi:hypothetical protein